MQGTTPYVCNNNGVNGSVMQGTYTATTTGGTANGDQCFYSWAFEYDDMGNHVPSPTSDTLGYCIKHNAPYRYDSNGDGMVDGSDAAWPQCDTLAIGSNVNNGYDATYFGCVSTTTATTGGNPPFQMGKRRLTGLADMPRAPYHVVAREY
jgi:hypothetical protein